MNILFLFEHPNEDWWMDGLSQAIDLLGKEHTVTKWNLSNEKGLPHESYDSVIAWGAFGSKPDMLVRANMVHAKKKLLCLAGNATAVPTDKVYDVIFYETEWVKNNYLKDVKGELIHAFGINSQLFNQTPGNLNMPVPMIFDYLGVGSFSSWKRWEKMAEKTGIRMVMGEYQLGNEAESLQIIRNLIRGNVWVSNSVNPFWLSTFYNASRCIYIPATLEGGGERSVLEARASGTKVEIESDNPKLQELLECPIWDEFYYVNQLKKGL